MNDGDVVLLQNTRYRKEETKNEEAFSKELASLADLFVNDAFGTAHRAHCSNVGVSSILKPAVAGYLIEKEINFLGNAVNNPVRPLVAILGGSKVSSKISVIENLLKKVDKLIIGGGMAYTFFAAQGKTTGTSLLEPDYIDYAKKMLDEAGDKLLLPVDTVVAKEFANDAESQVVEGDIPDGWMGLDIGPRQSNFTRMLLKTQKLLFGTVLWAYLKWKTMLKVRKQSPKLLLIPMLFLSSAAVTPSRLSTRPAWPTRSATSPRAAALPWNTSKANSSRVSYP